MDKQPYTSTETITIDDLFWFTTVSAGLYNANG